MNSRPRKLGEMPDSTRLETAQTVAPVGTVSWLGMEFSCALEKLVCLRVIELYCLLICGAFHRRAEVGMWHSKACLSAFQHAGAVKSTRHKSCNIGWEGGVRFSCYEGASYRQVSNKTAIQLCSSKTCNKNVFPAGSLTFQLQSASLAVNTTTWKKAK